MSCVCSSHVPIYRDLDVRASLYLCENNMNGIRNVRLVRQPKSPINHLHALFHSLTIQLLKNVIP